MTTFRPPSEAALLDLVGEIYDCAIDPGRWPSVLESLARLMQGAAASISFHNIADNTVRLAAEWNIPADFQQLMIAHMAINPAVPATWYHDVDQPFGAVEFVGEKEMLGGLWYKSTIGRVGYHDGAVVVLAKSSRQFGAVTILRSSDLPFFARDDLAPLRLLAPHIRRAVMIADLLDARALERDMLSTTLELLAVGIVLTDESGRMIHANHAALKYLDEARALRRDGDRLSARDPKAAAELRQAIVDAAGGSTIDIPRSGIAVPVGDLAAWVLPLDGGLRGEFASTFAAKAVVFIREIGDTQPLPAELFVRRYGITPAECRLLVLLAQGMTITEAAETLGIALSTAKTHLARLFHKTGTQRQAELIRLAMSAFAPAAVMPDEGNREGR